MIVSWNWLQEYVKPGLPPQEVARRLTMSGLNLESIEPRGLDFAIDLEVTSNRPDCLGHLGIAREAAVICGAELVEQNPEPVTTTEQTSAVTSVEVQSPELCPRYIARVIRGVKIGPSPAWLRERLEAIGITPVNNVVDVTNYVLMECGQPLHAFDFDKLDEGRIVVRRAQAGEKIEAIDHKTYQLTPEMCVIADARKAVAIAGVMGGASSEVSAQTRTILIEAAAFTPSSIRSTARELNLHSPSSYRFERGLDPERIDWASRRCCELILKVAGGELLSGSADAAAEAAATSEPIRFRAARVEQVVGISIPEARCVEILRSLGLELLTHNPDVDSTWRAPSWRRDLTREIDLIEEVARIHGYEHIPESVSLPTAVVVTRPTDTVRARVQNVLTAAGLFEAVTFSFTVDAAATLFTPPRVSEPLYVAQSAGEYGSRLRQCLLPSLILARRENERRGTLDAELFEVARVFLGTDAADPTTQPLRLGMVTGRSFRELKGIVEAIVATVNPELHLTVRPADLEGFTPGRSAELLLNQRPWGWMGELDRDGHAPLRDLKLRDPASAAELDFALLVNLAVRERRQQPLPEYPSVLRDFNFVIDEGVAWDDLSRTVRDAAGPLLESVVFVDQYQGKQIPAGQKSYVLSLTYRAQDRTLTGTEIDAAQNAVLEAVQKTFGATQR